MTNHSTIAVIGAGSIGAAWAIVFAHGGCAVRLYNPDPLRRVATHDEIVAMLADVGLLTEGYQALAPRTQITEALATALADADYVQENTPETLKTKQALFADFARLVPVEPTAP